MSSGNTLSALLRDGTEANPEHSSLQQVLFGIVSSLQGRNKQPCKRMVETKNVAHYLAASGWAQVLGVPKLSVFLVYTRGDPRLGMHRSHQCHVWLVFVSARHDLCALWVDCRKSVRVQVGLQRNIREL